MFNPVDVVDFFELLDDLDSVSIEENQKGENVTLDDIKSFHPNNNCLHHILVHNNHRIVIQTYKDMRRKGDVDIVQGNIELEPDFQHMVEVINARPQDYTDNRLNKLFVLYCGMWQKCSMFIRGKETNSFMCDFGPNVSIMWIDTVKHWTIYPDEDVTPAELRIVENFVDMVDDIVNG